MYSFDVFDTLITRTTANPFGIFALMQNRMKEEKNKTGLDEYVIDNFYTLRIHSEELIRKSASFQQVEEVGLQDIYKAMSVNGCLSQSQIVYLCHLEEKIEIANTVGISENIQKVKELLKSGERVVLISDMYLSEKVIRKMLVQADPIFKEIPIYVSSEYGMRKTTGNLYRKVQKLEQISYEEWTHIGDNLYQDIEVPYWLGIKVKVCPKPELSVFEQEILKWHGADGQLQLMVGTSIRADRNCDLTVDSPTKEKARHIGCRYVGPILYSYAEWIVGQAEKKGFKRLYFIARDGYLIKKIVDIILSGKKTDIKTYYIYGSRKSWRMASLSKGHYNLYQQVLWSHICRIRTLDQLADVLHVPLDGLYHYLPGTYAKNKKNTAISNQELQYITEKLSVDTEFQQYHLQELKAERTLAKQYLAQEIDVHDDNFAFVDVSGGGLTQGCLKELIKERYSKDIHTFFFKIDRVNLVDGSITDTFMPGFLENNLTVEMMCRAPHGQTMGYMECDGRIVPRFEEAETQLLIRHGFYQYEKGILDFAKLMCKVSDSCGKKIGSMRNILLYLRHIAQEPSAELLEYFASMPSSESGREKGIVEYAPRLTEYEIKEIFLRRTNEPFEFFYKGTDLNYSIMRASENEKALIERCKKEHDSTWGRLYRQEEERERKALRAHYGRAAFYPVRLLDEKIVLYGAGKFGQDLYKRLKMDQEHEVVLWVDKNAESYRQKGMSEVYDVSRINIASDEQIVIAVMIEDVAEAIYSELKSIGIHEKRMIWIQPYTYPVKFVQWKTKKIG